MLVEAFLHTFFHMAGGNWYSHRLLQILGDAVTLWPNGSYPDTPSSVLEENRQAGGGGQRDGMNRAPVPS